MILNIFEFSSFAVVTIQLYKIYNSSFSNFGSSTNAKTNQRKKRKIEGGDNDFNPELMRRVTTPEHFFFFFFFGAQL